MTPIMPEIIFVFSIIGVVVYVALLCVVAVVVCARLFGSTGASGEAGCTASSWNVQNTKVTRSWVKIFDLHNLVFVRSATVSRSLLRC